MFYSFIMFQMPWTIGTTFIVDLNGQERIFYVDDIDPDVRAGRISYQSPLGCALLDSKINELVNWQNHLGSTISARVVHVDSPKDYLEKPSAYSSDKSREAWCLEQANHFLNLFEQDQDGWNLTRASKFFRLARKPRRSIEITSIEFGIPRLDAALLTTQAAALLDLKRIDEAWKCIQHATALYRETDELFAVTQRFYAMSRSSF
jgi:Transcription elongation factor, GreA/GreB, C-term